MEEKEKKTYTVHYSFYLSDSVEVEADSEEAAEDAVKGMLLTGEIGNLDEMEIGEQEVWVD